MKFIRRVREIEGEVRNDDYDTVVDGEGFFSNTRQCKMSTDDSLWGCELDETRKETSYATLTLIKNVSHVFNLHIYLPLGTCQTSFLMHASLNDTFARNTHSDPIISPNKLFFMQKLIMFDCRTGEC